MMKLLAFTAAALTIPLFSSAASQGAAPLHTGIPYHSYFPTSSAEMASWAKIAAYRLASYLTDPLCNAREYIVRSQIIDDLAPSPRIQIPLEEIFSYVRYMQGKDEKWWQEDYVARFIEKSFFLGGTAICSAITPFTAIPAIALRFAASQLESEPFIHYTGLGKEKELEFNTFTHMHWNICGVKAGYDIEEGGQLPIRDVLVPSSETRLAKIAEKILEEDPDVLCLNEVFDINDAIYLVSALQHHYAHFVVQCGTKAYGLTSGLFFATKFGVKEIVFKPFPKEFFCGKASYAEKGFLSVETHDRKRAIAQMILSHLQHSNEPAYPTLEEERARKQQLQYIMDFISQSSTGPIVLAGDLNLDDTEFVKSCPDSYPQFLKRIDYNSPLDEENHTWLGDLWYVEYGNRSSTLSFVSARDSQLKRKISPGINLDHVLVRPLPQKEDQTHIETILKRTGYDPSKISRDSLSDHMILLSKITLP